MSYNLNIIYIICVLFQLLGDWLENSGWTDALIQANITSSGTADSFIRASHVTKTRHAHRVTAATLHTLLKQAYSEDFTPNDGNTTQPDDEVFEEWCTQRARPVCTLSTGSRPCHWTFSCWCTSDHFVRETLSCMCNPWHRSSLDVRLRSHSLFQVAFCTYPWYDEPQWQTPWCPGRIQVWDVCGTPDQQQVLCHVNLPMSWTEQRCGQRVWWSYWTDRKPWGTQTLDGGRARNSQDHYRVWRAGDKRTWQCSRHWASSPWPETWSISSLYEGCQSTYSSVSRDGESLPREHLRSTGPWHERHYGNPRGRNCEEDRVPWWGAIHKVCWRKTGTMHEASYRHIAQEQVANLQSVTDQLNTYMLTTM